MTERRFPFTTGPVETRDVRGRYYTTTDLVPTTPTSDTILEAQGPGVTLSLGKVWRGDLQPILQAHTASIAPLVTPFTIGNELDADSPLPGMKPIHRERPLRHVPLEPKPTLGRTFGDQWRSTRDHIAKVADAMREQIKARSKRDDTEPDDDTVDLGPVMNALTNLKDQANNGHPDAVGAAIAQLSGAINGVGGGRSQTNDRSHVGPNDFGRMVSPAEINKANREHREQRSQTRDAQVRAPSVSSISDRPKGRMQQANEAFRARREAERREVQGGDDWPPQAA